MSRIEVGYVWHERFLDHHVEGHPESATRLRAVMQRLRESGELERLRLLGASPATFDELCELHEPEHVTRVHSIAERGGGLLDDDTYLVRTSFEAAALAAGAAMRCAAAVMGGEVRRSMALVRPPGHHAFADHGEGFCLFNNAAFAARAATGGLSSGDAMWSPMARRSHAQRQPRAMIIDFDVHHGNGTEDIFAGDERVLMLSTFQTDLYPFLGDVPKGPNMVNVPLRRYTDGKAMRAAVAEHWLPALAAFQPELIMISAGFDAHRADDMAQLGWQDADYRWLTHVLSDAADRWCAGRIVSTLEGGYDLDALARSVALHVRVLADLDTPMAELPALPETGADAVPASAAARHAQAARPQAAPAA